ncbi:hypothetical protein MB02_15850 [Croceicoccus estronivorus]|uniref:TetR/AcrR family transcriptional regulator n=1 Tax=Croceicoccus estronivorus TaxID=1172626 RepID=UPI000832008A|nr:TetR/AcrR family transcriptional regulator [Croceicoccus estronivorus]OCC22600.1 hypothetical protein MB02_15850 [Croceicoccus estronivorus]
MTRKRISGPERRALILAAARRVFSLHGYDGAKTLQIAREAKVSEALVYRHFPSKLALYRAVMQQVFSEQDNQLEILGIQEASAAGLVRSLKSYFCTVVAETEGDVQQRFRMMLTSLSGDGNYASQLYRRSQRLNNKAVNEAHRNAREAGDLTGKPLNIANTAMFIEHVGTMICAIRALDPGSRPYESDGHDLVMDAVWFCCRGIGLTDEAIARYIDE